MEWIFLAIAAYVVYRWLFADTKREDGARQPTTTREPGYGEHPRHQGHSRGRASSSGGRTNADVEHTVKQAIDAGKNIKWLKDNGFLWMSVLKILIVFHPSITFSKIKITSSPVIDRFSVRL